MARQMIDIGLDNNDDLVVIAGDFGITESTAIHQRQLILNNKGDFKQNPTICAGAFDYLDDEDFQSLIRAISIEFTKDGMDVLNVLLSNTGDINSDAFYK